MPLLKKIIKNSPSEVIVKWTGSGTDTLTLASLTSEGQTLTGVLVPAANIVGVSLNASGASTITRNGEVALQMNDTFDFQSDGVIQAVLNENSGSSVVVTLASLGTLIMRLKKSQGYTGV
jgi:hypothetical protein